MTLQIIATVHRAQRRRSTALQVAAPTPATTANARPPARVALLLALAATIDLAVGNSRLASQREAARCLCLSPARITQLLALLQLAPDIQEQILFLEVVDGLEPVTERQLRPLTRVLDWSEQRAMWAALASRRRPVSIQRPAAVARAGPRSP